MNLLLTILLITSFHTYGFLGKPNLIDEKEIKNLSNIKVESGGLIEFEQYVKKKFKYNNKDGYSLTFYCSHKKRPMTECELVNYDLFTAPSKK